MSVLVLVFHTHFPQVRSFPAGPCPSWEGKGRVLCDPRESNRQSSYTRINGKWYRLGLQTSSMMVWGLQQMLFPKNNYKAGQNCQRLEMAKGMQQTKKHLFVKIIIIQVKTASVCRSCLRLFQAPHLCGSSFQPEQGRSPSPWLRCCRQRGSSDVEYRQSEW